MSTRRHHALLASSRVLHAFMQEHVCGTWLFWKELNAAVVVHERRCATCHSVLAEDLTSILAATALDEPRRRVADNLEKLTFSRPLYHVA